MNDNSEESTHLQLSDESNETSANNPSSSSYVAPRKSSEFEATIVDADELDSEEEEEVVTKKGRGLNKEYEKLETTPDYNAALKYMSDNMKTYHFRYTKETNDGDKKYYTCNGFPKCPKVVFILLVSTFIFNLFTIYLLIFFYNSTLNRKSVQFGSLPQSIVTRQKKQNYQLQQ